MWKWGHVGEAEQKRETKVLKGAFLFTLEMMPLRPISAMFLSCN